jgi:hypothetical protein
VAVLAGRPIAGGLSRAHAVTLKGNDAWRTSALDLKGAMARLVLEGSWPSRMPPTCGDEQLAATRVGSISESSDGSQGVVSRDTMIYSGGKPC